MTTSPRSQDLRSLGINVTRLPPSVTNLVDCVAHEIGVIEDELNRCYDQDDNGEDPSNEIEIEMESLEDAIDDGFMCVDLKVLERKLEVWHRLFSPAYNNNNNDSNNNSSNNNDNSINNYTVTPFFAVKCNPDPLVVEWLARSSHFANLPLGFDCASIAELELAKKNIEKYSLAFVTGPNSNSNVNHQTKIPRTRIVYANPQRAEADLIRALELFASPTNKRQDNELWLTLDGIEEVYKIAIAKERFEDKHNNNNDGVSTESLKIPPIKIVLRIWVPDGHSQVPLGEKFGMRLDQIDSVLQTCLEQKIPPEDIIGISFHCGSGCESVETYLEALEMGKTALRTMDNVLQSNNNNNNHRCWLMDIGGGFPGLDGLYGDEGRFAVKSNVGSTRTPPEEKKEGDSCSSSAMATEKTIPMTAEPQTTTVADIAVAVRSTLQSFATGTVATDSRCDDNQDQQQQQQQVPLTLIAEPGRYFVEGAFALASKIYQKKILRDVTQQTTESEANEVIRVYRIPHGVQGVFKDVLLCGESFVPRPLRQATQQSSTMVSPQKLYLSRVLGPSGDDSEDVVCDSCWLPELDIGDWLVFDRMGAYTLSIASRAGRPVMRYVMGGGSEPKSRFEPSHRRKDTELKIT